MEMLQTFLLLLASCLGSLALPMWELSWVSDPWWCTRKKVACCRLCHGTGLVLQKKGSWCDSRGTCQLYRDLEKKTLVFPEASNTAHVVLRPARQQPLTSFTVCLRSYTDLNRPYSLFSYATKKSDNELLVFKPKPNQYSLYVGGSVVTFSVADNPVPKPQWEHICMSWESATGIVELMLNGYNLPRRGIKRGYTISPEASIVLGQEQDSFGGGFDINQSFLGETTDVYMWDRVLSSDELGLVQNGGHLSDCLIDWRSLNYEIRGYVVEKPSLFPPYM